jgi:hypothetical protein
LLVGKEKKEEIYGPMVFPAGTPFSERKSAYNQEVEETVCTKA